MKNPIIVRAESDFTLSFLVSSLLSLSGLEYRLL